MPAFSVVIPLYNKGPHIERTLLSVLSQTIQDFEVVIIEGGSEDDGPEIVKKMMNNDYRIRLIRQNGKGVSLARNQGVLESKSDFIAFLDADDEWTSCHLDTLLRLRKKYPMAGAYTSSFKICRQNGELSNPEYNEMPPAPWEGIIPNYFKSATLGQDPIWTSAVGIPKKIFREVGYFPVNAWFGEDTDMWGRIALKYPIAFSWEIGAIYHMEAVNRICYRKDPVGEHPFVKTASKFIKDNKDLSEETYYLKEYIAKKKIQSAFQNIVAGHPKTGKKQLKNCETKIFYWTKIYYLFLASIPHSVSIRLRKLIRGSKKLTKKETYRNPLK